MLRQLENVPLSTPFIRFRDFASKICCNCTRSLCFTVPPPCPVLSLSNHPTGESRAPKIITTRSWYGVQLFGLFDHISNKSITWTDENYLVAFDEALVG